MMKTKLIAMFMASLVLFYTGCSEKEVETLVVDHERLDQLRQELRALQLQVYGEQVDNSYLDGENEDYDNEIAELQAEIDELKAMYDQTTKYQVIVVDYQGQLISGASVTLNQNGTIFTATTDADGKATFENVRAGAVVGVVSATGFAKANYTTSLVNASGGNLYGGVNTRVPLLPKSGALAEAGMFTLTGFLYANTNAANDTARNDYYAFIGSQESLALPSGPREGYEYRTYEAQNKKMKATLYTDLGEIPGSHWFTSARGAIRRLAYEDVVYEATLDANNKYSIKLPVNSVYPYSGSTSPIQFYFEFSFEEFTATKTFVDYDENGTINDGLADGNFPSTAFPAPKTFTETRIFRIDNEFWETSDFGLYGSLGAQAGQTYEQDFYYSEYRY